MLNKIETQSFGDEPSQRRTGRRRGEVDACTEKAATLDPDVRRVLAQIPAGFEPIRTLMVLESYMTPALHSSLISDIERSREHVRHSPSSILHPPSRLSSRSCSNKPSPFDPPPHHIRIGRATLISTDIHHRQPPPAYTSNAVPALHTA